MRLTDIIDMYGLGKTQDFLTFRKLLNDNGYTIEDVVNHIEDTKKAIKENSSYISKGLITRECPGCGGKMGIWEVNTRKDNQVGGNYKSQWICLDELGCGYQGEYSELTIEEQVRKYDNP